MLRRLNHALAFVFGGYQDYEKFYTPSLLDEDGGLFVAIMEQLFEKTNTRTRKHVLTSINAARHIASGGINANNVTLSSDGEGEHDLQAVEGPLKKAASVRVSALSTLSGEDGFEDEGVRNSNLAGETTEPADSDEDMGDSDAEQPDVFGQAVSSVDTKTIDRDGSGRLSAVSHQSLSVIQYDKQPPSIQGSVRMRGDEVNSVRLAEAHAAVKRLKNHTYNIFEAAFFYGPEGDQVEYLLNGFQVFVTYLGMFYLFYFLGVEIRRTYKDDPDAWAKDDTGEDKEWLGIMAINMIGLGYFFFLLGRDVERVILFNRCMMKLCPLNDKRIPRKVRLHRALSLTNNFVVNVWFGYALFIMNFFFVQAVDDFVEAILNAIAVVFIIQIDDIIRPYIRDERTVHFLSIMYFPIRTKYWLDWENKKIHSKLMEVVESHISRPDTVRERVTVRKKSGNSIVFRETDVCYFFVNKNESVIRIFCGRMRKTSGKYRHVFEEVTYEIGGPGSRQFLDNMAEFECVEEEKESKKVELHNDQHVKRTLDASNSSDPPQITRFRDNNIEPEEVAVGVVDSGSI